MESITEKIERLGDVIHARPAHISALYNDVLYTMNRPINPESLAAAKLVVEICEDYAFHIENRSRVYDAIFVHTYNPTDA